MKKNIKLTIFTPTYNRGHLLTRLYKSLEEQKSNDFEWLIVDDGSTDNTKIKVNELKKKSNFPIRYIFQQNSGKWKSFNNGVLKANGNLFFCVDSDDMLYEGAINNIIKSWTRAMHEKNDICGIIGKKIDTENKQLSSKFPPKIRYSDTYTLTEVLKCRGEFALIYKVDVLKRNLFPDTGEKFITENVIYDKIALQYKMFLLDKVLNICEYQSDGLSHNIYKIMLNNPIGYKIYYSQRIDMAITSKERFNYLIRYNAFHIISKTKKFKYRGKWNWLVRVSYPLGLILKNYYERKKK